MSLLGNQTMIKENDYLFAPAGGGGGGGGAVNKVSAGNGIVCNPITGNVIVSNSGVISITDGPGISSAFVDGEVTISNTGLIDTRLTVPLNSDNPEGLAQYETIIVGTIDKTKLYNIENNFYTCNLSFTISNIVASDSFSGTLLLFLTYGGISSYASIVISDTYSQSYAINIGLGFQSDNVNNLILSLTNQMSTKINSYDYGISNFYCVNQGTQGAIDYDVFG
tara:strand:- start:445 stop:1113 length:669 start_codon:yes stop_codon:yes gene_type:complete